MANPPKTILLQELDPDNQFTITKGAVIAASRDHDQPWRRRFKQLPLSKAWHTVLWDRRLEPGYPSNDFILVSAGKDQQPSQQHFIHIRHKLRIPIHANWAEWLWTRALAMNEATPLTATNINAWHCVPSPSLLKQDITEAVKTGLLTTS